MLVNVTLCPSHFVSRLCHLQEIQILPGNNLIESVNN
jgi:hypothetical protein